MFIDLTSFIIANVFGVISILIGIRMMRKMVAVAKNAEVYKAKVVDQVVENSGLYFPVIEFETSLGRKVKKKYPTGSSAINYPVGDEVEVICKKDDPEDFIIKGNAEATFSILIFFVGIILIIFAFSKYF